ncbi:2-hydroxyacid dehydrogenase [Bacillus solimangrovi]|uniref:Glyoxylate/hydroxypyruvate reductase B n=1 Tax=Bacillus solimangrovi TaxID=1305675 RepID=A0A1E5LIS0_9BACI|nr:D-glycerate dehydrogenase [Bacillus solimangrovi]OEH93977.1 D-glycerate dehydrogenase [Bacillus solimangrovi]
MKPYIYITRKLDDEIIKPLYKFADVHMWNNEEEPVPRDILMRESQKADALLTMLTDHVDDELLKFATNLKVIANLAVGYDNIDINATNERNIIVTNTPDVLNETTADLVFLLVMASARRLIEANQYIQDDKWTNWAPMLLAGRDVHHKTIGIVGLGRIGQAVAKRAKGFDMNILYYNRTRNSKAETTYGAVYCDFNSLLEKSDFVVCMVPLSESTKGLFGKEAFGKMKNTAIFVNASRGAVVDEDALYHALKSGEITAAGLDVFTEEPISSKHPLLSLSNVTALPHIGSASIETRHEMMQLAVRNISSVLQGKKPITPVNV